MATAFAGPLSRFYAQHDGDAERLRAGVEAWREDLRRSVAERLSAQLDWDEAAPAATFDLGDSGLRALRLFALHAERAELELPDDVPPLLEFDPAWRAAAEAKFAKSLYAHVLACELWLPGDFPVTVRAPLPNGDSAEIGSLAVLIDQLKWLNQRTFAADPAAVASWRELPAPNGSALLPAAQRGFAALAAAAAFAARHRTPLALRA